jgi:hypothetical protein
MVERLRPQWLTARSAYWDISASDAGEERRIQVYVDGVRQSMGPELLRQFQGEEIMAWGTNHGPHDASSP